MGSLSQEQIIERYFIENRSRLLDIAAFLDRVERATRTEDFRIEALLRGLEETLKPGPGRVERIQLILSDLTLEPLDAAMKSQSAQGAHATRSSACC